ncbi:Cilia- and flagella-associated protein 57 [Bienertia sinuspersici]
MSLDLDDDGVVSEGANCMRSVKDRAKRMKGSSGYLRTKKGASGVKVEENLNDLEEIENDFECLDLDDEVVFVDTLF